MPAQAGHVLNAYHVDVRVFAVEPRAECLEPVAAAVCRIGRTAVTSSGGAGRRGRPGVFSLSHKSEAGREVDAESDVLVLVPLPCGIGTDLLTVCCCGLPEPYLERKELEQLQQIDVPLSLFSSYREISYHNFILLGRCASAD